MTFSRYWLACHLFLAAILPPITSAAADTYYKVIRHPKPVQLPDLVLTEPNGKSVRTTALRGKYVVLNLWATWCGPCVKELPSLDSLQAAVKSKDVLVVALSQDRAPKTIVPQYLKKLDIKHLSSYYDPQASATKAFRVPVLPTTLVIDPEGREVGRIIGALDWSSRESRDLLSSWMQKS